MRDDGILLIFLAMLAAVFIYGPAKISGFFAALFGRQSLQEDMDKAGLWNEMHSMNFDGLARYNPEPTESVDAYSDVQIPLGLYLLPLQDRSIVSGS